jgi:hypothetical protein
VFSIGLKILIDRAADQRSSLVLSSTAFARSQSVLALTMRTYSGELNPPPTAAGSLLLSREIAGPTSLA